MASCRTIWDDIRLLFCGDYGTERDDDSEYCDELGKCAELHCDQHLELELT